MRPLRANLSLFALEHNICKLKSLAPKSQFCAVVKANAYGHRISLLLPALQSVDYLVVACIEEALAIRKLGSNTPILLLEGVFELDEYPLCARHNFAVAVYTQAQLTGLIEAQLDRALSVFLKVDTGMHRLGIAPQELSVFEAALKASKNVQSVTLMSHFSSADNLESARTQSQQEVFKSIDSNHAKSLCNSAGILAHESSHYDLIRAGIALYGVSPFADKTGTDLGLKAVLSLSSRVIHHQWIKKGEAVGYGATFITPCDMPIGTIACGYADGYPREISTDAYVLINNYKAPIVGRVSMDMFTVDLSKVPEKHWLDEVVLWGENLPIEWVAKWANTISYTILTHLAPRVHFLVVD